MVRPINMIESQLQRDKERLKEPIDLKIEYIQADAHDDVEDITEQISELEKAESSDSGPKPEIHVDNSPKQDLIIQKSINLDSETQIKKNNKNNLNAMAEELVDQIKDIVIKQFKHRITDDKYTHCGIVWAEWKVSPIRGTRYKWAIWIDYNLCDLCEVNNTHDHIFMKIRDRNVKAPMLANLK